MIELVTRLDVLAYFATSAGHCTAAALIWRRNGSAPLAREQWLLLLALFATSAWGLALALDPMVRHVAFAYGAQFADIARYGVWFGLLHVLLHAGGSWREPRRWGAVGWTAMAIWLASFGHWCWRLWSGHYAADEQRWGLLLSLGLSLVGALLTEQLFRNLPKDSRWHAKPVCLGLGVVFGFDAFHFAEGALFGRLDPDAAMVRGLVHCLSLPLLLVAVTRRGNWVPNLQVSHTAAFYSATLVLAGAYLLLMAGAGYYVRYFGGEWGRALQMGLLFAGLLALLVLIFTASLRAQLRVFVHKNFFSYRYDYRQEWLHFTSMLSGRGASQEVGVRVIRGLANMLECPSGALWMLDRDSASYRQVNIWNMAVAREVEPADSSLVRFLRDKAWIVDLDEHRMAPQAYDGLTMPLWLLSGGHAVWLVVPLTVDNELLGFVTLGRPRTTVELNWEVRDLLKTASRQAAGFLAQILAAEALLEARKFESFNRMSAFVVHDLKNIVTQLALMLKNAERHADNPEFRQDMLITVQSSVEKMRRLMLQLREGAPPPGGASGVDLTSIAKRLQTWALSRGRSLELDIEERLSTRGHDDRLERVLGHLVHNAFDATPATGRVWLRMHRQAGQVLVEIGDTGVGMTRTFIDTRLFKPFSSTKEGGMGIGLYESAQYVRELGGRIDVQSQSGVGTVVQLELPLFERDTSIESPVSMTQGLA